MILVASAAWNLVTAIAFLITVIYSFRLGRMFKGGKISKANTFAFWGFAAAFVTFFVSFLFNLVDFSPTSSYGISVKDLGVLVAGVLIMASLRESSRFWRMYPDEPVDSKQALQVPIKSASA